MTKTATVTWGEFAEDDSGGGGEFYVTGQAREVVDPQRQRAAFAAARAAGYRPAERHVWFELLVAGVLATAYDNGPKRERWSAKGM